MISGMEDVPQLMLLLEVEIEPARRIVQQHVRRQIEVRAAALVHPLDRPLQLRGVRLHAMGRCIPLACAAGKATGGTVREAGQRTL